MTDTDGFRLRCSLAAQSPTNMEAAIASMRDVPVLIGLLDASRKENEEAVAKLRKLQTAVTLVGHVCGIGPCRLCSVAAESVGFLTRHPEPPTALQGESR